MSEGACAPVWEGVPQSGRVYPRVGGCTPEWESAPQCGRVCPSVGGCAQCGRVCPVWVSLSRVVMTDTQVHLCVHLITGRFNHVAKAYMAEMS